MKVIEIFGDVIETASEAPAWLRDQADALQDIYVNTAERVNQQINQTAPRVEENLRQYEFQQYGSQAAGWLSQPQNLLIAFAAVVVIIIGIRKL